MRYVLIFQAKVVNVLDWDGMTTWPPPEGHEIVPSDVADIGDTWDGQKFNKNLTPTISDYYTPAEVDAFIDGIDSLAKARAFLKLLVRHLVVKK